MSTVHMNTLIAVQYAGEINLTAMARKNTAVKKSGGVISDLKTDNGNSVESSRKAKEANKEVELTDKEKERVSWLRDGCVILTISRQ